VGADGTNQAFAWMPQTATFLGLNSVFGWTSGVATAINDHGDIVGNGNTPLQDPRFANLAQVMFSGINDSGQISGTYLGAGNVITGFLYTPGQPLVTFPNATPYALNSVGQLTLVTETAEQYFGGTRYYSTTSLYTAGQALTTVFGPTLLPRGLNDDGAILGNPTIVFGPAPATLWTPGGGAQSIQNLLPSDSGLRVWIPQAINNFGQILTWVYLPGPEYGSTSVILTPVVNSRAVAAHMRGNQRAVLARGKTGMGCGDLRLNSRSVC
jgi:hypothetical protein